MTPLPDPDRQPEFYENVPAKRLVAWVVDTVLIVVLCVVAVPLTGFIGLFIWPLMYAVIGFAYRVVSLANWSATPGMAFAGMELRSADGNRFDTGNAILHTAGYTVSFAFPVLQVISVAMMLTGARGQGLTDTFMGSVALNRRVRRFG